MLKRLPELERNDYLTKGAEFWKNYREILTEIIIESEKEEKKEKTPENIVEMAIRSGVKPTARYFGIEPSTVRYWLKKIK